MTTKFLGLVLGALVLSSLSCGGGGGPVEACHAQNSLACDKLFKCTTPADRDATFVSTFGSTPAECKTKGNTQCTDAVAQCPMFNSAKATSCNAAITAQSCPDFLDPNVPTPADCDLICGPTQ